MKLTIAFIALLVCSVPAWAGKARDTSESVAHNVYEGADSFAGKMKDTARHAYDAVRYGGAHYAKEKVEDAKAGSRDAAIGASRTFRDKAADAGDYLKDKIQDTFHIDRHETAADRAEDAAGKAKHWYNKLSYKAGDAAEDAKYAAKDSGETVKHRVKRFFGAEPEIVEEADSIGDRVKHALGFDRHREVEPSLSERAYRRVKNLGRAVEEEAEDGVMDRVKGWFGYEAPHEPTWSERLRERLPFGHGEEVEEDESFGHKIKRKLGFAEEDEEEPTWGDRFKQIIWAAREEGESEDSIYDRLKQKLGFAAAEEPTWRERISRAFRSEEPSFGERVRSTLKDKTNFLRGDAADAAYYAKDQAGEKARELGSKIRSKLPYVGSSYEPSFWERFLHVFGLHKLPSELREHADELRSRAKELEREANERDPSWFGDKVGDSMRYAYDKISSKKDEGRDKAKDAYEYAKDSVKGAKRRVQDFASRTADDYDLDLSRLFGSRRWLVTDVISRNLSLIFSLGFITLAFLGVWLGARNNWQFDANMFRGKRLWINIACSLAIGLGASLLLMSTSKMALDGILEAPWKHASGDMRREVQDRFECCGYSSLIDHVAMPCMHVNNCRDMVWRSVTRYFRPLGALLILLGAFGLIGGRAGLQRLQLPITHLRQTVVDAKNSLSNKAQHIRSDISSARTADAGQIHRVPVKETNTRGEGHIPHDGSVLRQRDAATSAPQPVA